MEEHGDLWRGAKLLDEVEEDRWGCGRVAGLIEEDTEPADGGDGRAAKVRVESQLVVAQECRPGQRHIVGFLGSPLFFFAVPPQHKYEGQDDSKHKGEPSTVRNFGQSGREEHAIPQGENDEDRQNNVDGQSPHNESN